MPGAGGWVGAGLTEHGDCVEAWPNGVGSGWVASVVCDGMGVWNS